MTIVIRTKRKDLDPKDPFYNMERSIPWPPGAVSAYRSHSRKPWKFNRRFQGALDEKY